MRILMSIISYVKINFIHTTEIETWIELKRRLDTLVKFINMKIEDLGFCRENDVLFIIYDLNTLKKQALESIIKVNNIIYKLENERVKMSRKERMKLMDDIANLSEISNIICTIGNTRDNYIKLGYDGMRELYGLEPIIRLKSINRPKII